MIAKNEKVLYCDYCGAEVCIGIRQYREHISCGSRECNRMERDDHEQEREEAHRDLDDRMGWL